MKKIISILIIAIIVVSCSIGEQKSRNSVFEKRLYTKGYHFKGFKRNVKLNKQIEDTNSLELSEFKSENETSQFKSDLDISNLAFNRKEGRENAIQSGGQLQRTTSKSLSKFRRYNTRRGSFVLTGDSTKSEQKITNEEKRRKAKQVRRNYLSATIFGGIGLFFFWSLLLLLIFGAISFILGTIAKSKERQLIEDGVKTDKESLEKIESLLPIIPLVFLLTVLSVILTIIFALLAFFAVSTPLALAALFFGILSLIGYIAVIVLGVIILIEFIKKTVEFRDMADRKN